VLLHDLDDEDTSVSGFYFLFFKVSLTLSSSDSALDSTWPFSDRY